MVTPVGPFEPELVSGNRIRLCLLFQGRLVGTQGTFRAMHGNEYCEVQFDGENTTKTVPLNHICKIHRVGQCVSMVVMFAQNVQARGKKFTAGMSVFVESSQGGRTFVTYHGKTYAIRSGTYVVFL
jgi:hypothetical protein